MYAIVSKRCRWILNQATDFIKEPELRVRKYRESNISLSAILTIMLFFQQTPFTCFKHSYVWIQKNRNDCFPNLVSYSRFVRWKAKVFVPLYFLFLVTKGQCDGVSFIDATSLKVCKRKFLLSVVIKEYTDTKYFKVGLNEERLLWDSFLDSNSMQS